MGNRRTQDTVLRAKLLSNPRYLYLRHVAAAQLPLRVADPEEITHLLTLSAAGLIDCELPNATWEGQQRSWTGAAVVHRLTKAGLASLEQLRFKPSDPVWPTVR